MKKMKAVTALGETEPVLVQTVRCVHTSGVELLYERFLVRTSCVHTIGVLNHFLAFHNSWHSSQNERILGEFEMHCGLVEPS